MKIASLVNKFKNNSLNINSFGVIDKTEIPFATSFVNNFRNYLRARKSF